MFRFFVKWYAKRRYVFKEQFESSIAELSAKAALKRAADGRDLVARMTKEADDIDARIKEVVAMEENGFWECEKCGAEDTISPPVPKENGAGLRCVTAARRRSS